MHTLPDQDFSLWYKNAFLQRPRNEIFITHYDSSLKKTTTTFAEFQSAVESLNIQMRTVKANVVIAKGENTTQFLVLAVATLLAGKTFFPINPLLKDEQIYDLIHQYKLNACLFPNLDVVPEKVPSQAYNQKNDFIYILTSGTTGKSKIVRQRFQGLLSNVTALIQLHQLSSQKKIMTPLPFYHVNALEFSFFCSLICGSELIIADTRWPAHLIQIVEEMRPNIISIEPTLLNSLNKWVCHNKTKVDWSFAYIVTAASALSQNLYREASSSLGTKIIQGYGLSETINFSALMPPNTNKHDLDHLMLHFSRTSIGNAVLGNSIVICDEFGQELGPSTIGELVISGETLMSGYLSETSTDNSTLYKIHTGDLGFYEIYKNEKFYFISGRKKEVAKRNSITIPLIELDEKISLLLGQQEDCIAVSFLSESKGEDIALLFKSDISTERIRAIQELIIDSLPPPFFPSIYIRTQSSLRTISGKARRATFKNDLARFQNDILPIKGLVIDEILPAQQ